MASAEPWIGKTVLIVDDSALMREEIANVYRAFGMEVKAFAGNGLEALEKYSALHPDLVSIDIVMPEMNGIDCYRKLRVIDPEARMIFISCLAGDHIIGTGFKDEIPASLFVGKPINKELLHASLQEVFNPSPPLQTPSPPSPQEPKPDAS